MTKNCNCGRLKPYRRAYACWACWKVISEKIGFLISENEPRRKGIGTLRFGGKVTVARG